MYKKVLVVDDEDEIRDTLSDVLDSEGYVVVTAASGEEGVRQAEKEHFDIALLDVRLGGQDGIVTYWQLKRMSPSTKAVIMTAHYKENEVSHCIHHGVDSYIQKPFDVNSLLTLLNDL